MRIAGLIGCVVLAGALAACAEHKQPSATAPVGYAPTAVVCPLAQLTGVKAIVHDIDKGVAITFTAPKGEIDQLRDNVHAMADANDKQGNAFAYCPCAAATRMGAAEQQGATQGNLGATSAQAPSFGAVKAEASVEEIPKGAILKLKAKNDSDIQALRSDMRNNVDALNRSCLK